MSNEVNGKSEDTVTETDFTRAIGDHGRTWQRMALQVTGNVADADEAVQLALIAAWRKRSSFRGDAALASWIGRMVLNQAYNQLRRNRREGHRQLEFVRRSALHGELDAPDRVEQLLEAIGELDGDIREAAAAMVANRLDTAATAEKLGWPLRKLYDRWARAKRALRQMLETRP